VQSMELTNIGIDKWGKVFITFLSNTYWLESKPKDTIDDAQFTDGSAKILVNNIWYNVVHKLPFIIFGPYMAAYTPRWIDGRIIKTATPKYEFLYGNFATFVAGEFTVDLEGDNKCFTCVDDKIFAIDKLTGADIYCTLNGTHTDMSVFDKIQSWEINYLGLLEIKYFNLVGRVFLCELPQGAIVEQIAPFMLQIDKQKTITHLNINMHDNQRLAFIEHLQNKSTTEINTFYGKYIGIAIDDKLATFNILNTQVFKNTYGEIIIGDVIKTNGKKTKPALSN
jgi:hypothetical protein